MSSGSSGRNAASTQRFQTGRHAGVVIPLFSIPSRRGWGIGEIPDLARLAGWLSRAGLDCVQLLPINEMEEGQNSPYSALSAMAIDPVFIAIDELEDFVAAGDQASLDPEHRDGIARARDSAAVDYETVRRAKAQALQLAYFHFVTDHWKTGSDRDRAFHDFRERERWWLDDYGLFRALHADHEGRYWREWPEDLRDREPGALEAARARLTPHIRYYEYLQWIADAQWQQARRDSGSVGIFGDFPFMVSGHSADVWARQREFRLDASVGVPPDAFSTTGQNWGLPAYRWDVCAENNYDWLRQRAARCAALFDGFRVDHLVGFYRTFVREADDSTAFVPSDQAAQVAQGEALLDLFGRAGARIIAEDLGVVPDFVRESLTRARVPGFKVLRWEREWQEPGRPFRDPAAYPRDSVATTGTHDTATLAEWWDSADVEERRRCAEAPAMRDAGLQPDAPFSPAVRDALLRGLFAARSDFVLLPIQDVFGWRDRINTPAVVSAGNWTWRLPWPVEDLLTEPEAVARAVFLRELALTHALLP